LNGITGCLDINFLPEKDENMSKIQKFFGEYAFLSNFSKHVGVVTIPGKNGKDLNFHHVEGAFQAMKCEDPEMREDFIALEPNEAKRLGNIIKLRKNWEDIKDNIMFDCLKQKFEKNNDLKELLIETGDAELIEGNTWHDNYWGVCCCERCKNNKPGKNRLGKLLMKLRASYK
jgi:ribA/ribD-fused uncharacterized protein